MRPKVLLVDDEPVVLDYLERQLVTSDFEVARASNGETALLGCERNGYKPDLLVADLVLPGMSGFDLSRQLERTIPGLRTLFISGYTGLEYFHQKGVSLKDLAFLQKPFTPEQFLQKVQELIGFRASNPRVDEMHRPRSRSVFDVDSLID
jgi:two-component system cell cycle sensor histidine kinase/response regulator CckA